MLYSSSSHSLEQVQGSEGLPVSLGSPFFGPRLLGTSSLLAFWFSSGRVSSWGLVSPPGTTSVCSGLGSGSGAFLLRAKYQGL